MSAKPTFLQTFLIYLRLGCISFGGPVAHLGYFHEEFVERRKWLSESQYADLVALCQFLPGPASSQVGYTIGLRRGGLIGGLAAWLGFTLPSAILMTGFGLGLGWLTGAGESGWVAGLKVAAAAVVAHAVCGMAKKLCPDWTRRIIALIATGFALLMPNAIGQILVIIGGGVCGYILYRNQKRSSEGSALGIQLPKSTSPICLTAFGILLIGLPLLTFTNIGGQLVAYFDSFYRTGALVFGGGHVMLPLLQGEVVNPGWVAKDTFLAGYGAAQALPGPLFTFSAFLGASMLEAPTGVSGALVCLIAIFLPSMLLLTGVLPFWDRLQRTRFAAPTLLGTNAAVVGLLAAALINPVIPSAIFGWIHVVLAIIGFIMLAFWKLPSWVVVGVCAAVGFLAF